MKPKHPLTVKKAKDILLTGNFWSLPRHAALFEEAVRSDERGKFIELAKSFRRFGSKSNPEIRSQLLEFANRIEALCNG